jgi:hypothetical protein
MSDEAKNLKQSEFLRFLEKEAARLHMNMPAPGAVRETIDSLAESNPHWETEISPEDFAKLLKQRYPELRFEWSATEQSGYADDEPATEKQIAYLRVLEVPIPDYLGLREASDLIDKHKNRVSDGQKRRLDFYGLKYPPNTTREEATALIDAYKADHPESEEAYQAWKSANKID